MTFGPLTFLDAHASLATTPVSPFGFLFCQRLWTLTKRWDDILVADIVADMVADMEVDMVADMEVEKVAGKKKINWQSLEDAQAR